MKLKKLFEKFDVNDENIPQTILDYESMNYDDMHKETIDEYKKVIVFTKKKEIVFFEGIFDADENRFTEFSKYKENDTRYSHGGVDENGIFI